jgi:hypothetical protein
MGGREGRGGWGRAASIATALLALARGAAWARDDTSNVRLVHNVEKAPPSLCRTSSLAVTRPGSRAILVCGSRFVRQVGRDPRHAEATLIHEVLHSLGLGEDPPSPDFITERIEARCWPR